MEYRGAGQAAGRVEHLAAGPHYFSLIDGVRGLAAFAVLLFHYVHFFMAGPTHAQLRGAVWLFPGSDWLWPIYIHGQLAVQVFWLISGFVFAQVYCGSSATSRSFAINRFARLYPLHLLTLLVVAGLQAVMLLRFGYTAFYGHYDLWNFVKQLFLASDWLHGNGSYSFNGPIWSVSVEVVVYVLFWLSRGAIVRFGLPLVAALVLGSYFADRQWEDITRVFDCGFYFFIGCGLNLVQRGRWGRGALLALPVLLFAAAGIWGAAIHDDWSRRFLMIPGLFGALFLLLALAEPHAPRALRRICEWLGENTYGLYLWHVPIQLVLLLILLPATNPAQIAQHGWFLALFLGLAVIAARASYVWFERPARDFLRHRLHSRLGRLKGSDNAP